MSSHYDEDHPLETPITLRGVSVTDTIRTMTGALDDTNDGDEPSAKRPKYLKLTPDQLPQLIVACSTPTSSTRVRSEGSPTSVASTSSMTPAYVSNAKYEAICCHLLTPLYDGTEENLMPFLLHLDIRRQDEGWAPAIYITVDTKRYDLTVEFSQVTEEDIVANAKIRWQASTVATDKHTIGHDTCNARLLAKCLLSSISPDLSMTLLNRTPTQYCNDGTYLLWAISNNIYRNNVAFVEIICEKIYTATLADHNHDVEKYLIYIKNNLKMITTLHKTKQHTGLITYILCQLHHTKNPIFLHYIQDLHIDYQEGKLPKYSPVKLIHDCEDKIRVL
jgi:hypothetical protein